MIASFGEELEIVLEINCVYILERNLDVIYFCFHAQVQEHFWLLQWIFCAFPKENALISKSNCLEQWSFKLENNLWY